MESEVHDLIVYCVNVNIELFRTKRNKRISK